MTSILALFEQHEVWVLVCIGLLSLVAGFIDSIVGGGGLIQFPALSILYPNMSVPMVLGTNKIAGLSGTSVAAFTYAKRIKFDWKLLGIISAFSFIASYFGAQLVSYINVAVLKPVVFFFLILIALYTYFKKDFGTVTLQTITKSKRYLYGSGLGVIIGFYDGFLGPGTGSFLVLGFIALLGFDFLEASAYAKMINCVTNISALYVFITHQNFCIEIAVIMAIANIIGSSIGSRMALLRGNHFIRKLFLVVVGILLLRYGYDVFY